MGLILSMDDALMMELVFYLVLFFNVLIILFVLTSKIKYNITFLILGNFAFLLQHIFVLLTINTSYSFAIVVNMFDIISASFYGMALLKVFDIELPKKKAHILAVIILLLLLLVYYINPLHSLLRFVTNIIIAFIYLYMVLVIDRKRSDIVMQNYTFLVQILIYAVVLKTTVGIVRLYSSTYEVSIESIQSSVVVFTFLSLLLAISLNIVTLFLQYDKVYGKLKESSSIDFLTQVYNRKFSYEKMEEILSLNKRGKLDFAIILLDINGFKQINDNYGHLEGDKILSTFAKSLKDQTREIDYIGRYGGDEFIILSIIDDKTAFDTLKDRILKITNDIKTKDGNSISISGGAYLSFDNHQKDHIDDIIHYVDQLLYKAKEKNSNIILL